MEHKTISIAPNRQVTLPKKFFEILSFGSEADCYVENNKIVIQPKSQVSGEFDEYILDDLINQGYSGIELSQKFKEMRKKVRPAIQNMIDESENTDQYYTYDEVFEQED